MPPAFALSQDQTLRFIHKTDIPHPENAGPPINPSPHSSRRLPQCSLPTPEQRLAYRNASVIHQNTSAPQSSAPDKPDDTTPSPQNAKPAKTQTPGHAP